MSLLTISRMKSPFIIQLTIGMKIKKVGLIRTYFIYSFYNVERMKRSTLRMAKHYQLKRAVTLRKT